MLLQPAERDGQTSKAPIWSVVSKTVGPVEKEHFGWFGFGLIFCSGLGL
jgi:hypothetical protein